MDPEGKLKIKKRQSNRILLFRVLHYQGPLFSETPIWGAKASLCRLQAAEGLRLISVTVGEARKSAVVYSEINT